MAEFTFNWIGALVIGFNIILTLILLKMRRVGIKRSGGISGWVTLLFGTIILVAHQVPLISEITAIIALIMAIIVIFAILLIMLPALSPHTNLGALRHLTRWSRIIGWFVGYLIGILIGVLT